MPKGNRVKVLLLPKTIRTEEINHTRIYPKRRNPSSLRIKLIIKFRPKANKVRNERRVKKYLYHVSKLQIIYSLALTKVHKEKKIYSNQNQN